MHRSIQCWVVALLLGSLLNSAGLAQSYSIASLPEALKANAHAVVRHHVSQFYVKDIDLAVFKTSGAITVLDAQGERFATLFIPYNKFTKVNDIEAQLYDASGKQIKKLKRSDIEDFSTASGSNSIDDSYVKVANLNHSQYPYTVVFRVEYSSRNMMFYPTWRPYPYSQEGIAVEKSTFVVSTPKDLVLRYKEINMPPSHQTTEAEGRTTHTWEVTSLPAITTEPMCPPLEQVLPQVLTAPTDFRVDDYSGQIKGWHDIAKFINDLNKGRDQLPQPLIEKVQALVKNEPNVVQRVRIVYEFLQNTTRYVSIQLGIGGWQTMKAEEVFAKGYGDCKALSNYTTALLKSLGIPAFQTLIRAGEHETDLYPEFPSFQFNHVLVCVPVLSDTLWLECTSQHNPFGFMGSFTSDRYAVVITNDGGKLVRTPKYRPQDNGQVRWAQIKLNEQGDATAQLHTAYSGEQYETRAAVMHSLNTEQQKLWLTKALGHGSSAQIQQFLLQEHKDRLPVLNERLSLLLRNAATLSGSRLFVTPNLFTKASPTTTLEQDRRYRFEIQDSFAESDSLLFELPDGYTLEYLPEAIKLESRYGYYHASVSLKANTLYYRRRYAEHKGSYAPELYNDYVEYRKKIVKADKVQVVLVKK